MVGRMELLGAQEMTFFRTIAAIIIAFVNDTPPKVAIDQARRGVASDMRLRTARSWTNLFKEVDAPERLC